MLILISQLNLPEAAEVVLETQAMDQMMVAAEAAPEDQAVQEVTQVVTETHLLYPLVKEKMAEILLNQQIELEAVAAVAATQSVNRVKQILEVAELEEQLA